MRPRADPVDWREPPAPSPGRPRGDNLSILPRAGRLAAALVLALGAGIAATPTPAEAQTRPAPRDLGAEPPASAIFIGNSFFFYNNGLSGHVTRFLRGAGSDAPFRATAVTIGGAGFDWHDVESYFRPNAIGRYSFDARNNIVFNPPGARLFDIAIMMDCSLCPIHPELSATFHDYARRHAETVRRHGVRPVFFMTWAFKDRPEMTQGLAEAYTTAGNANGALVIPAGLAFARAYAERPALDLHDPDLRHPSLAGTYLAAAVAFATVFDRSPVENRYTAGLNPEDAAFLRRVAWETVRAYFGTQRAAAQ